MSSRYRVAIIGCGGISRAHANAYRANEDTELVAAADINEVALERFAQEYNISARYTDYRELLRREAVDIVSICTWPDSHAQITIDAAEHGVKGILCEKPMCTNMAEADAMIAACKATGAKLAIGHNRRFLPGPTEARRLIANGAIGKPTLIRRSGSGGLTNKHSHSIDLIRYILNDPPTEWVIAQVERRTDRYERAQRIEDLCGAIICFRGGARLIIESDIPETDAPESTYIYGTDGILDVGRDSLRLLNTQMQEWQRMSFDSVDTNAAQVAELIQWIEGGPEHRCSGWQGRATMEILMGIYESARIRGIVHMPIKTKASPLELMIEDGSLPVEFPGKYDIRRRSWLGCD